MRTLRSETLTEICRFPICFESRVRLLDRWAHHRECSPHLRRLARFLLALGFGCMKFQKLFKTCQEFKVASGEFVGGRDFDRARPSDTLHYLPFVDRQGTGWLSLGVKAIVYRYSDPLQARVEWRHWRLDYLLDGQRSTELVPWDGGWLCLLSVPYGLGGSPPHRFIAFNDRLAPISATQSFFFPRSRAHSLCLSTNGEVLIGLGSSLVQVPACQVRARLEPLNEATLEFPSARTLRELQTLRKGFSFPGF